MKKSVAATLIFILILASLANAVEWKSRMGGGLRGPLFSPMIKGNNYTGANSMEPFMMGLGTNLEVKYGLTNNIVLGLSGGYWYSYDDITAADDQSFKLCKDANASAKLKMIPLSLTGQFYFIPESNIQPYLLGGFGIDMAKYENLDSTGEFSSTDLNVKVGAGINFWVGESFTFDVGGRFSYLLSNMSNSYTGAIPTSLQGVAMDAADTRPFLAILEPGINLTYYFGGARDTDKDGIKDKFDQCPDTPLGAIVDEFGCPLDSDGDGIYDGIDHCVETPKGAFVDEIGCPLDSDQDIVPDGIDLCPDTPIGVAVDIYGCPLDEDKDGIPDFKDQQLDTPAGAIVDSLGIALDTDGDDVPDGLDKCPETREGVRTDEFGCPLAKPITEKIILNIKYASGSVEPDGGAKAVLDDIVERLQIYSGIKIEINGYTDALGSAKSNLKISQKRAEAIRDYLISKGIEADRLEARGYGEDENFFLAPNDTAEGRHKNRRIEIVPK
ncbi:MAG: OmpA family protein [candidate division Zixibacteria bacterium]|nr:OmpA family protein [candidate division Zixibacteria bacterium]